jgi:hypothetical protein
MSPAGGRRAHGSLAVPDGFCLSAGTLWTKADASVSCFFLVPFVIFVPFVVERFVVKGLS